MAQQFSEDEMVFNDIPATLAQHITDGYIAFSDGSYIICNDWQTYATTDAGTIPARKEGT